MSRINQNVFYLFGCSLVECCHIYLTVWELHTILIHVVSVSKLMSLIPSPLLLTWRLYEPIKLLKIYFSHLGIKVVFEYFVGIFSGIFQMVYKRLWIEFQRLPRSINKSHVLDCCYPLWISWLHLIVDRCICTVEKSYIPGPDL